jgi:hypothetical protein
MVPSPIDIKLSIERKGDEIISHLIFSNNSSNNIDLDTWAIFADKEIRNNYFEIMDEDNNKVKYTGMLIKRMFRPEDYIPIKPGEKISTSISINDVYKLVKGKKYTIRYFMYHPSSLEGDGLMVLESNKVKILY